MFEGVEKKLQRVEDTLSGLADKFRCNSTGHESVDGELTDIRDRSECKMIVLVASMSFLLQLFLQNYTILVYRD